MNPTAEQLLSAMVTACSVRMDESLVKIKHCVAQLDDQQVWWRPAEDMNSIGNLLLHLSGNLRQWLIAGLTDAADERDRPGEFSQRETIAREQLIDQLSATIDEVKQTLGNLSAAELLASKRIQGFELNGIQAIFDSVPHLSGHVQEIVCLTRLQLGGRYQFFWTPTNLEQGA